MAKLTKAQAQKWNAELAGGFRFDVRHYLMWGEKVARRNIELEGGKILQASLEYHEIRDGYRYTGQVQPTLHLQIWKPGLTEGMMHSSGMGASIKIGTAQDKKLWKELCKLSGTFDDKKLLELMEENMHQLKNEYIA